MESQPGADTISIDSSAGLGPDEAQSPGLEECAQRVDGGKAKASPLVTVTSTTLARQDEKRRRSSAYSIARDTGIYWRSVAMMVLTFVIGLGSAVALHGYYSSLNGKMVGTLDQQQLALRIGTALGFVTQVALVSSVNSAYVQCLWKALKRSVISFQAIDAAFATTTDLLAFFNKEMLLTVKVASFLALIGWCIPIASVIAPATLNVSTVIQFQHQMMNIPALNMSQFSMYSMFSYFVPTRSGEKYEGPRTFLTRSAVATATTGQVLQLNAPATNASYTQSFTGPYVQCLNANETVANQIDAAQQRHIASLSASISESETDYFAFVPALSNSNASTSSAVQVANLTEYDASLHASNQLWLRVTLDNSSSRYLNCQLMKASYDVDFSWSNGIQSLDIKEISPLEAVPYPVNPTSSPADEEGMAYSAYMWALSSQLVGSIGFDVDLEVSADASVDETANGTYSLITTAIDQTVLIGSSDFNFHFQKNHAIDEASNDSSIFSLQRLQDMALARNRTLDVLIQELASNMTLSLLSNPLVAPPVPTDVTISFPSTLYSYRAANVLLAYGLAISFALFANLAGLYAYRVNGVSHDNAFSSIVCTTRDIHFSRLNVHERLGALPLDPRVGRTRLMFDTGGAEEEGEGAGRGEEGGDGKGRERWGFGLAEVQQQ